MIPRRDMGSNCGGPFVMSDPEHGLLVFRAKQLIARFSFHIILSEQAKMSR